MTTQVQRALQNDTLIESRLKGMSCREIAALMDTSAMTISRRLNDEDVRAVIDTATRELTSYVPDVVVGYADLIKSVNEKIKLEAFRDITKITGIAPSHTSNQFFVQINQKNVNLQQNLTTLGGYAEYVASQADGNEDYVEAESEDNVE